MGNKVYSVRVVERFDPLQFAKESATYMRNLAINDCRRMKHADASELALANMGANSLFNVTKHGDGVWDVCVMSTSAARKNSRSSGEYSQVLDAQAFESWHDVRQQMDCALKHYSRAMSPEWDGRLRSCKYSEMMAQRVVTLLAPIENATTRDFHVYSIDRDGSFMVMTPYTDQRHPATFETHFYLHGVTTPDALHNVEFDFLRRVDEQLNSDAR